MAQDYGNNPATIAQFLKWGAMPDDGTKPLNDNPKYPDGCIQHLMSFEEFKQSSVDILLASIPAHYTSFARLIKNHKPNAKLICHFGNVLWEIKNYPEIKNVMASVASQQVPNGVNVVFYHEEFPLDIYKPISKSPQKVIRSFVNTLAIADLFKEDWQLFLDLEKAMPDYKFESYGASCREGIVNGHENIVHLMQTSIFGFHLKSGGDGMGIVIHNWFATGRPPIVKYEQYKDKLAGKLMMDGQTCIFADGLSIDELVNKIRYYSEPIHYSILTKEAFKKFKEVVNFNDEFVMIKKFLDNLI